MSSDTTTPASRRVNTREAGRILGISPSTLKRWRFTKQKGAPPFIQYPGGGAIRYDLADLENWMQARKVDPASPMRIARAG